MQTKSWKKQKYGFTREGCKNGGNSGQGLGASK